MNTWDADVEVRNENLAAGLHAQDDPLCDVTIWCDSATRRFTRWTLLAKHNVKRDRRYGRITCPACKGPAWWMIHRDDDEPAERGPGLLGHLLHPFRRDQEGEAEDMTDCVVCRAIALRDELEPEDTVQPATMIMDGNGVCDQHGKSMLQVLASRLPEVTK